MTFKLTNSDIVHYRQVTLQVTILEQYKCEMRKKRKTHRWHTVGRYLINPFDMSPIVELVESFLPPVTRVRILARSEFIPLCMFGGLSNVKICVFINTYLEQGTFCNLTQYWKLFFARFGRIHNRKFTFVTGSSISLFMNPETVSWGLSGVCVS